MKFKYNPMIKEVAKELKNHTTEAETLIWQMVGYKKIKGYQFQRKRALGNCIADFYCYPLRLVIEINEVMHLDEEVQIYKKMKEQCFNSLGLIVLRFTDDLVLENWNMVEREIIKYIEEYEKKIHFLPKQDREGDEKEL